MKRIFMVAVFLGLYTCGCSAPDHAHRVANEKNTYFTYYEAPGFNIDSLEGKVLAIGGLVFREGRYLDDRSGLDMGEDEFTLDTQTRLMTPYLDSAARELGPDIKIFSWYQVMDNTDASDREKTYQIISKSKVRVEDHLGMWAESLEEADYILFGRVNFTSLFNPQIKGYGYSRTVSVSLEVCDLHNMKVVWALARRRQFPYKTDISSRMGIYRDKDPTSGQELVLEEKELPAPAFLSCLADVLVSTIHCFPGYRSPLEADEIDDSLGY